MSHPATRMLSLREALQNHHRMSGEEQAVRLAADARVH
jgi:hypothetical protein